MMMPSSPKKLNDDDCTVGTVLTSEESITSDPASPSNRRNASSSTKLRFDLHSNQVFPIPHIDDLSEAEIEDVWYQKADYDAIKSKIIPILRKMMKGEEPAESDKVSIRGIECRTRKGSTQRQKNKTAGKNAVLDEQKRQRAENIHNPELIREEFRKVTAKSLEEAIKFGQADEAYLQRDLQMIRFQYGNGLESSQLVSPEGRNKSKGELFRNTDTHMSNPLNASAVQTMTLMTERKVKPLPSSKIALESPSLSPSSGHRCSTERLIAMEKGAYCTAFLVFLSFASSVGQENVFQSSRDQLFRRSCRSRCGRFLLLFRKKQFRKVDGIYCEEKCQVFRPDGYDDCGACICGADNAYDCQPESGTPCGYIGEIGSSDVCQCYLDYEKVPICAQPPVFTDDCPAFCGNSTDCGEGEMCADLQDDVCFDQTAGCDPGEFPANQQCVKECLNVDLDMEQTD